MHPRSALFLVLLNVLAACGDLIAQDPDGGSTRPPDAGFDAPDAGFDPPDTGAFAICGPVRAWDSDGDSLSDRVEQNNGSNNYADLLTGRCDEDPSRAVGSPGNGSLIGGLNLPDRNTGYQHFYGTDAVDTDDWGILPLLTCIEATGRALAGEGIPVQIGDISLRNGGVFPPHAGHQNGLEGDLRYVRIDRNLVPLDLRFDPDAYDPAATRRLFETMFDVCNIDFILVDKDELGFTIADRDAQIIDSSGHSNHFHIRIRGS